MSDVARMSPSIVAGSPARTRKRANWLSDWRMYLLILPGLLYFLVFHYLPLLGNIIAFQDYSPFRGMFRSEWIGLGNFAALFSDPRALNAIRNTLVISFLQLVFAFPAPIALAIFLHSVLNTRVQRFVQSIVYIPHFLSWVIVVSLWVAIFGSTGLMSSTLQSLGFGRIDLVTNPDLFKLVVILQVVWKEIGWGTIIFFAAISMIPQEQYEAAAVDGAGPWRRLWHVTLPGLRPVIVVLFILRLGSVLTVGFEQILLQQEAVGSQAAEVLDTFVYFRGVQGGDWGLAAAAGLVQGLVGTCLVVFANRMAKLFRSEGAF